MLQLAISTEAADRVRRAGGRVAIDLIQPVGCGKSAEVAIDTHLTGKDLSRYAHATHDDVEVLLAPALTRATTSVRLEVTGPRWWRRLEATLDQPLPGSDACAR